MKNKPENFVTRPPDEQEFAFVKIGVFLGSTAQLEKQKNATCLHVQDHHVERSLMHNSKQLTSIWSFACPIGLGILIHVRSSYQFVTLIMASVETLAVAFLQTPVLHLRAISCRQLCNCDTVTVPSIVSTIKSLLCETSIGFKTFACERLSGVEKYVYLHFAKYFFTKRWLLTAYPVLTTTRPFENQKKVTFCCIISARTYTHKLKPKRHPP